MAVKIQYDKASHPAPSHEGAPWGESIPFIQFDRQPLFYGGKWGQVVNITLNGTLYEPVDDYPKTVKALEDKRDLIIECFNKNLRTFEFEDGTVNAAGAFVPGPGLPNNRMVFPNTVVESIEFPQSGYHALLEFVIRLKCYEQDYFIAQGVLDPQDQFELQEGEDGSMTVSHTVSARGVDYESVLVPGQIERGLNNAVEWVNQRMGDGNMSNHGAVTAWDCGQGIGRLYLVLLSQDEKINRLEGVYSITESFLAYLDEENAKEGVKAVSKYSVEMSRSINEDFRNVTISGVIKGGKNTTMDELRAAVIKNDDVVAPTGKNGLYEIAVQRSGMDGSDIEHPKLHRIPTSYTLEESVAEKTINVKAKFDTNPLFVEDDGVTESRHFFDHTVDVQTDEITQITKVTVKGKLNVRGLNAERICYIQKFLDNTDLMKFLAEKAKAQYEVIMKVCYECSSGGKTYWAKATPEQMVAGGNTANDVCSGWRPPFGTNLLAPPYGNATGVDPELCWQLHPCATAMSVTRNESEGQLEMSATFTDTDSLLVDKGDESKGCYDKAGYNVTVNNPVNFVKANASGQKRNNENDYNGHWAIQKFGIETRAKSTTKIDLTMRQDANIIADDIENKLRQTAEALQITLNDALLQNGTEKAYIDADPDVPALVYDINKNISHKDTASQSIASSLERSYVPEPDGSFCVGLPEPAGQKQCFDCVDSSGVKIGDEIYAHVGTTPPPSGGTTAPPQGIPLEAYELCDTIALSYSGCNTATTCWECYEDLFAQGIYHQGLEADALIYCENNAIDPNAIFSVRAVSPSRCATTTPGGGTTPAPTATTTTLLPYYCLTPQPCKNCYKCYADSSVDPALAPEVQGVDYAEAEAQCMALHGCDTSAGCVVYPCETTVKELCYECIDSTDGSVTATFNALTQEEADYYCLNVPESAPVASECAKQPDKCWTCINTITGDGFSMVIQESESDALDECRLEGENSGIGATNVDITNCDGSGELKCWQCADDAGTIVFAYTEAVAETNCSGQGLGGLDSAVSQPVGCS
jgi:hypothetical protein